MKALYYGDNLQVLRDSIASEAMGETFDQRIEERRDR